MKAQTQNTIKRRSIMLIMYFLLSTPVYAQSVLTFEPGTSMGVLTGSDLCVNIINGAGLLYGGGTICGGLVSVEPVSGAEIPAEFSLMQNFPNPFNPKTNVKIRMPKSEHAKLVIFDITGKEIAILVDEILNAGVYSVDFDATHLASGTYFYRMTAGEFTDVKKMILVK